MPSVNCSVSCSPAEMSQKLRMIHQSQGEMIHFLTVDWSAPNHWSQSTGTCNPRLKEKEKNTLKPPPMWNICLSNSDWIISPSHTLPSKPMKFPRVEHQPLTIPIITISSNFSAWVLRTALSLLEACPPTLHKLMCCSRKTDVDSIRKKMTYQ